MAQKIDTSEFSDQFTDGTVRYSQSGIDRVAKNTWSFTLSNNGGTYTIRTFQFGVLANLNAASTTPLVLANTFLQVYDKNTLVANIPSTDWAFINTGIYQTNVSSFVTPDTAYTVELKARASFTNPPVSAKISVVTDGTASYASETIFVDWVAAFDNLGVTPPVFDGVDFALNGNISFR